MAMEFIALLKACGLFFMCFFGLCLISGLIALVANIINLGKARQFLASGGPDKSGFKRFQFWPKVLKGLGVLSVLAGLFSMSIGLLSALKIIMTIVNPNPGLISRGAYESFAPFCIGTGLAFYLFIAYYIFRVLLHRIKYPGRGGGVRN